MMTFTQRAGRLVGLVAIGVIIGSGLPPRAVARHAARVADPVA